MFSDGHEYSDSESDGPLSVDVHVLDGVAVPGAVVAAGAFAQRLKAIDFWKKSRKKKQVKIGYSF